MTKSKEIAHLIQESESIVIMGHRKGDGDSFGAAIALKLALDKIGKKVEVVAETGLPIYLEFLYSYFNFSIKECPETDCDLVIGVDWSELDMAACPEVIRSCQKSGIKIALIDHHVRGKFMDKVDCGWSDQVSCSTSEMVLSLLEELNVSLDKNIATALLTGIETDTDSYQNQNTSDSCYIASAKLMKFGARLQNIKKGIVADRTIEVLKLWGLAMERLSFSQKYNAAITYLTYKDAQAYGLSPRAINGPANFLNSIKGAKIVILVTEEEPGQIKVSLRTRDEHVDVSRLAKLVGGGGHIKASGFSFEGKIQAIDGLAKIL